ncbi:MAG: hypothetical protein AAGF11_27550 [Myxococcota bacterium]
MSRPVFSPVLGGGPTGWPLVTSFIMGLWARLRRTMADPHEALAARPLFEAMARGELPRPNYVAWLRVMAVVVDTVEQALDASDHADLASVWSPPMRTLPLLRADLPVFDEVSVRATSAVEPLLALVRIVRCWAREEPVCVLGALYGLYALTVSTLDGAHVHQRLA